MNPVLPHLARAAGIGALLGIGAELLPERSENIEDQEVVLPRGLSFVVAVVGSVALRALSYYLGIGTAMGAFAGLGAGLVYARFIRLDTDDERTQTVKTMMGAALIAGTLGYLAEATILFALNLKIRMVS